MYTQKVALEIQSKKIAALKTRQQKERAEKERMTPFQVAFLHQLERLNTNLEHAANRFEQEHSDEV